jgi:hypothetical protein
MLSKSSSSLAFNYILGWGTGGKPFHRGKYLETKELHGPSRPILFLVRLFLLSCLKTAEGLMDGNPPLDLLQTSIACCSRLLSRSSAGKVRHWAIVPKPPLLAGWKALSRSASIPKKGRRGEP